MVQLAMAPTRIVRFVLHSNWQAKPSVDTSFTEIVIASRPPGFTPVTINVGGTVTSIGQGLQHVCVLLDDGTVKCWGQNNYGQVGDGSTTNRNSPQTINVGGTVLKLAVGGYTTCVWLTSGTMKCWGYNSHGETGDGSTSHRAL